MKPFDVFLAILVALIWGLNFVAIKIGLNEFPPFLLSGLRFLFAAFPAVLIVKRNKTPWKYIVAIGVSVGIVMFSLLFIGMEAGLSTGLTSLVLQIQAPFTLLISAIYLKDKPSRIQLSGVLLAFTGILLLAVSNESTISTLGLLLVILSGLSWAISNIIMKKAGKINMLSLIVWMSLIPPIPLLMISFFFETNQLEVLSNLSAKGIGAILYMSLFSTILAYGLWAKLLKDYKPNIVAPFSLLIPIFGIYSSIILLGEKMSLTEVISSVIVFAGLVSVVFGERIIKIFKN